MVVVVVVVVVVVMVTSGLMELDYSDYSAAIMSVCQYRMYYAIGQVEEVGIGI